MSHTRLFACFRWAAHGATWTILDFFVTLPIHGDLHAFKLSRVVVQLSILSDIENFNADFAKHRCDRLLFLPVSLNPLLLRLSLEWFNLSTSMQLNSYRRAFRIWVSVLVARSGDSMPSRCFYGCLCFTKHQYTPIVWSLLHIIPENWGRLPSSLVRLGRLRRHRNRQVPLTCEPWRNVEPCEARS